MTTTSKMRSVRPLGKPQIKEKVVTSTLNWVIATYTYDQTTTLGTLLQTFLEANRHSKNDFAQELGCKVELVDRWLLGELTPGLNSRFRESFEKLTGIDVERLYVIEAKRNILRMLKEIEDVRKKDAALARLLELNPKLADEIEFESPTTRSDVIVAIRQMASVCGFPVIGLQIGLDDRLMSAWKPNSDRRPYGETLERTIIALASPLHIGHCDSARFMVAGEAILGNMFAQMGITSLETGLDVVFENIRDRATSVIANKTGLGKSVITGLLQFKPSGKIPLKTILSLLRVLFERREKKRLSTGVSVEQFKKTLDARLEAFDVRAKQFEEENNLRVLSVPPIPDTMEVASTVEKKISPKSPQTAPAPKPRVPATEVAEPTPATTPARLAVPADSPSPSSSMDAQIRALAGALLTQAQSARTQLEVLRMQFPKILGNVSQARDVEVVPPNSQPKLDDTDRFVNQFHEILLTARAVFKLPPAQRTAVLRRLDPLLVELQTTIEACGMEEPLEFINLQLSGRAAGQLLRG